MKQIRLLHTPTNAAIFFLIGSLVLVRLALGQTNLITNGSFEPDLTGWTASGNYTLSTRGANPPFPTEGDHAIEFNDGNRTPNAELSQSGISTTPGQSYTLTFDMGVYGYNTTQQQQFELSVTNASPASTTFTINGLGADLKSAWVNKSFTFTANSSSTTITFKDMSPDPSDNIDLLLDNVRLNASLAPSPLPGLLKVSPINSRYFTTAADPNGKAIYVTGSHNWQVLQDKSSSAAFNYTEYLTFLQNSGHNFFRMWYYDTPRAYLGTPPYFNLSPLPFNRAVGGPLIYDGSSEYQMSNYNDDFFIRLHDRCLQAQEAGIYVDVMLSGAWASFEDGQEDTVYHHTGWDLGYWNPVNNDMVSPVSQTQAYTNSAGDEWLGKMKAFMHRMVDEVYNLDNVVFEVTNEGLETTFQWQKDVIHELHDYEVSKGGRRHLIGFTAGPGGSESQNAEILASEADWVSLAAPQTVPSVDPPKPDILDTDHVYGVGGNVDYLWRSMMRGHNNIYMDNYGQYADPVPPDDVPALMRRVMGYQRQLADHSDLIHTVPVFNASIVSTAYALINADFEYLVYQPANGSFTINLPSAKTYHYDWIDPVTNATTSGVMSYSAGMYTFAPPGTTKVLHLRADFELTSAVSRKTHPGAGDFDVSLPLSGAPGIECRSADPATDTHTFVFTFTNPIVSGSATVTGTATISGSPIFAGNAMTVNLTGVANAQFISVTLHNVTDSMDQVLPDISIQAGILLGDTTANRTVNSGDVTQTKTQVATAVTNANFREDVTVNGNINSSDVSLVKTQVGTSLPPP